MLISYCDLTLIFHFYILIVWNKSSFTNYLEAFKYCSILGIDVLTDWLYFIIIGDSRLVPIISNNNRILIFVLNRENSGRNLAFLQIEKETSVRNLLAFFQLVTMLVDL